MKTILPLCVLAMISGGASAWQSAPQAPGFQKTPTVQKARAASKKKTAEEKAHKIASLAPPLPAQIMPPLPATLMNSAPVKPNVTMESGLLTIDAPNSTLSDVLSGVRKATGASIEGASPTERIAVKLGPGIPEQVIAALLRGTPYDYVILGSLGKQDTVTRVLLTQQTAQGSPGVQPAQEQPGQAMASPQQPTEESMPERTAPDDAVTQPAVENEADQAQQTPQPQQPPSDPNTPKTPEQLFKELQQLQQQQPPK
jgi:hypothetical protein